MTTICPFGRDVISETERDRADLQEYHEPCLAPLRRGFGGVVRTLAEMYGRVDARGTDPFEMILLENAAYLVEDPKRYETFASLRQEVGT